MGTTTLHWCFFQLSYRHDSDSLSSGGGEGSVMLWPHQFYSHKVRENIVRTVQETRLIYKFYVFSFKFLIFS